MPNLEVEPGWPAVRQLDRDEFASGGPNGNLNEHAKVFLARTEYLQQQKANKSEIVQGVFEFGTYAEFNSAKATLPLNCTVVIGEENNTGVGEWGIGNNRWNGSILKKSSFDPLQKANSYTDSNIREVKTNTKQIYQAPDQDVVAVLTDAKNKVLLGYDTLKDKPVVAGLDKEIKEIAFEKIKNLRMSNDRDKIAVLVDKNNKILIGYDTEKDEPILAGLNTSQIEIEKKYEAAFEQKLLTNAVNHFLFYGQSLSIGATATTILSTSQPYSNITFNTGPRMDSTATTTIPLVEQFNNPASDGGGNRGETCCSAAANYVSRSIEIDDGIDPASHVIFASTAGQGGTIINNLKKGSSRYNFMLSQVTKAKQLVGSDYKVQLVTWIQGESDIDQGTTYANYKAMLQQLQIDINNDIKSITGQADDIKLITYQCSYKAQTSKDIALAQLHLAQENANFYFACPTYRMPYYTDKTHLTNVGYKLMGAYFGRAYKQLVIDNAKPDFLNPKSAFVSGRKITISFDVPRLPLQIDTSSLAITQDYGFKVLDSNQNYISIQSINVEKHKVILNLSTEITSNATVRYALDYLGTGLNILNGGSGNLRDSSDEFVEILNQKYQLFNACPAFEITAFVDKGI